jgi:hypothetical protein
MLFRQQDNKRGEGMNWIVVYVRFMAFCLLVGAIRPTKEPLGFWNCAGTVMELWACSVLWTHANRLEKER